MCELIKSWASNKPAGTAFADEPSSLKKTVAAITRMLLGKRQETMQFRWHSERTYAELIGTATANRLMITSTNP